MVFYFCLYSYISLFLPHPSEPFLVFLHFTLLKNLVVVVANHGGVFHSTYNSNGERGIGVHVHIGGGNFGFHDDQKHYSVKRGRRVSVVHFFC